MLELLISRGVRCRQQISAQSCVHLARGNLVLPQVPGRILQDLNRARFLCILDCFGKSRQQLPERASDCGGIRRTPRQQGQYVYGVQRPSSRIHACLR